jgi:hypothetical protein
MGGRLVMAGFALAGTALTLWGNQTLFDAVAVSGTASLFLTPVLVVGLLTRRRVSRGGYLGAWLAAMAGALLYLVRDWAPLAALLPEGHKYELLLLICLAVLALGFAAVLAGSRRLAGRAAG